MQSDESSILNIKRFLEKVTEVDKTITQLPRGTWLIDIIARHNRALFINKDKVHIKYDVIFTKVRAAINQFLAKERLAINLLEESLKPFRDSLKNQPNGNITSEDMSQALKALKIYNLQMANHLSSINTIEQALEVSLIETKDDLNIYLESQPAGKEQSIMYYNGFELQIKQTVSKLKELYTSEIPRLYKLGLKLLSNS